MLICVDPTAYASAAETFGDHLASDVRRVAERLTGALSGMGAVAGHDPAGAAWAESYDAVAPQTVQAIDQLSRASVNVGALLQQAGFNHARAEAYSDVTGGGELPPETLSFVSGAPMSVGLPSAEGGAIADPPAGWEWLQDVCGLIWPDGDPGRLREMGAVWTRAADELDAGWMLVSQGITALDEQDSPEIESARGVCRLLGETLSELAAQCRAIGTACDDLAGHIESARSELITEVNLMLASIIAIEVAAGLAAAATAGIAGVAMQGAAYGAVLTAGARMSLIISRLLNMATLTGSSLVWKSADAVGDNLRKILTLTPRAAEVTPVAGTLKALDDLANRLSNSAWPLPPSPRGFAIETRLGGNLPPGFPTIDKFDWQHGIATSIKTVDLAAKSYQNASRLKSLLKRYVDKMAAFVGDKRAKVEVAEAQITERVLYVVVPRGATAEQKAAIDEVMNYAEQQGVKLDVEVMR
ncbi:hypothetical protein HWD99_09565 [Microbacterium sp. C5A9]|uniref:endonuclease toxin domain-containing protein n=1 Tax=Microbacterium sp. C5A9 TaxID=2736663 RepID=UPI001F52912D|nr:hypothetical protein [Microbacterium sp. C5A9]MCI1018872.1 hypothetical protein [Microbacterium sp. C5A9]